MVAIIGENSLYLLSVHIMDGCWRDAYMMEGQFRMAVKRVIVDLIIFSLVLLIVTVYKKCHTRLMSKVNS